MDEVIWKPVLGFLDYEISNNGRVRRVIANENAPCKELHPQKMTRGYLKIILYSYRNRFQMSVHRLVLDAFVGPAPEGHVCNHKDGNKHNNHVDNLEWVTRGDNIRHAVKVLGVRQSAKVTPDQVREIRRLYATGKYTQGQLGKHYGIDGSAISYIVTRRNWSHIE